MARQIEDMRSQSSESLNAKVLFPSPINRARNILLDGFDRIEVAVAGRGTKW
jgi:hypothetical protein